MKQYLKFLIILYVALVLAKILMSSFIPMTNAFSDDYQYLKVARSFFFNQNFQVHGVNVYQFPPLYPILISISYIFKNSSYVYFFIKLINALLSSLTIFPAYFMSKEILSEKNSKIATLIVALLPFNFSYTSYILSENLFYFIFLTSIYFLYKFYLYKNNKDMILTGIFIGLALLTRIQGVILLGVILFLFLLSLIKKEPNYKLLIIIPISLLVFSPWLIRNLVAFGFSTNSIIDQRYASEAVNIASKNSILNSFYPYIVWFITYFGALIISSLLIFPLLLTYGKVKDKKWVKLREISIITIFISLIIAANHHIRGTKYIYNLNEWIFVSGKLIGRYVDFVVPLIIILGFASLLNHSFNNKKDKRWRFITITTGIVLIISAFHFLQRSLFLPNNPSLSWIGLIKRVIDYIFYSKDIFSLNDSSGLIFTWASFITILIIFISILIYLKKILSNLRFSKILSVIFIFLLAIILLNNAVAYYGAKNFYDSPQIRLSLWLNNYDKDKISNILIDQRYLGDIKKDNQTMLYGGIDESTYTIIGYFLNDNLRIADVKNINEVNYIISKDPNLNFEIIKNEDEIYIYKIN